jgi:Flp pilus assembly protein TadG
MSRLNHRISPKSTRGISIIEMALVMPLVLMLLMGILEYGWMFWKNQEINNAARQGARVAVIEGATNDQVTSEIDTIMANVGLGSSGYTIEISPDDVFITDPGTLVTVTVTVPYANITLTGVPFLPVPDDLDGETSMVKEGPRN